MSDLADRAQSVKPLDWYGAVSQEAGELALDILRGMPMPDDRAAAILIERVDEAIAERTRKREADRVAAEKQHETNRLIVEQIEKSKTALEGLRAKLKSLILGGPGWHERSKAKPEVLATPGSGLIRFAPYHLRDGTRCVDCTRPGKYAVPDMWQYGDGSKDERGFMKVLSEREIVARCGQHAKDQIASYAIAELVADGKLAPDVRYTSGTRRSYSGPPARMEPEAYAAMKTAFATVDLS